MKTIHRKIAVAAVVTLVLMLTIPHALRAQFQLTANRRYSFQIAATTSGQASRYLLTSGATKALPARMYNLQETPVAGTTQTEQDKAYWTRKFRGSIALAAIGAGVTACGVAGAVGLHNMWDNTYDVDDGVDKFFTTMFLTPVVALVTAGGVTMTILGAVHAAKYKAKLRGISIDLHSSPSLTGVTFRYKF